MTFVYNAAISAAGAPNLRARVNVYQNDRSLISNAFAQVDVTNRDPARIPFASELDLRQLSPGAYVLEVNIEDLTTAKSVSQQTMLYVE
jgi:hypothetical protein